jgi:hypothetical protein
VYDFVLKFCLNDFAIVLNCDLYDYCLNSDLSDLLDGHDFHLPVIVSPHPAAGTSGKKGG